MSEQQVGDVQTVGEAIRAAMAEHEVPDEVVEEVVEQPVGDEPAPEPADGEEQEPEAQDDGAADEPAEEAEEAEEQEPEEVILAPASWSKEDRAAWEALPREAQEVVARRESERDRLLTRNSQETAPLKAVADEYKDYFRQVGVTPEQSFRVLVAAEQRLRYGTPQQKRDALSQIARDYGIEMPAATQQARQTDDDWFDEPDVAQLVQQAVSEAVEPLQTQLNSRQQENEVAEYNRSLAIATQFMNELESADPSAHPEARYVEETLDGFNRLVTAERETGASLDLDRLRELYNSAAWATPSVRDKLLADQAVLTAPKPETKTVRRVVKKSSSASSGGSAGAHSKEPPPNETVRDTLRRSMAELEDTAGRLR